MAKGDEEKLAKRLINVLKKKELTLKLGKEVKILSDLTCIKVKDIYKLCLGFTQVDIALYKQIKFDKSDKNLKKYIKFIQDSKNDKKFLNIPFIIFELKSGEIISDAIRSRNEPARKIKSIFPFCSYIFIGENTSKKQETLSRHGKAFDNFFLFRRKIKKEDINRIFSSFVEPYLNNLKEIGLLEQY